MPCLSLHQWDVYKGVNTGSEVPTTKHFPNQRILTRDSLFWERKEKKAVEGQAEKESASNFKDLD